jgi:signal transduction histidine kinase
MSSLLPFELVFNSSAIGNYLLSPDPLAIILAVNDAFLQASSRTRDELVGISLFEAFPGNPDDSDDTGETALRQSLAKVLATGQPDTLPAQRYPIRVEVPDGSERYEERFWSAVSTPIFAEDGRVLCISHTTTDVTSQVHAAAALRESEKRFRALISATTDVVYRMSPDWREMRRLEGRGFLKDTSDPSHIWLDEYVPADEQERVHRIIEQAIRNKTTFELEHRVRRADGTFGWIHSRAVPMLDAAGAIYEWIGAASDITERKTAEEKLYNSDRRKDEFLAMLAHELRNPLAPIGAAAQLLQHTRLDEARTRQTSQIIGRQVQHMTELIDDLLDVSRVTRGLVELDNTPLDISHIAREAVEQVTPLIQAKHHRLSLHLPSETYLVQGDKKRLVQIVTNLLNNAAKYTHDGGELRLCAEVRAAQIVIEVSDNGVGMTQELAARAFDLFAQAERTSDRTSGGLGLGLALVKSLVELHGGKVSCASPGPGKGSTFTVCLPRLAVQDGANGIQVAEMPIRQSAHALRIMVVDDNRDAAAMLAMLLEASGHQVLIEHTPGGALARAREEAPQVCLLDIGLPDMDGNELARRLRAQPETAAALLVAVTGYGQSSDRDRARAVGFDHHLLKPVNTEALYAILDGIGAA